jgi:hypothetical protein
MEGLVDLHHDICFFLVTILILVLWLGARIVYSFHHTRMPVPERFNHHTNLELIWAILPSLIVTAIALPSLTLIYTFDDGAAGVDTKEYVGLPSADYAAAYYQVGKTTGSLRWNAGLRGESFDQTNFFARETPNFDPNSPDSFGNPIQRGARSSAKVSPRFNALYILPKDGTFKLLGLRLFGYGLSQPGALRFSYNQLFTPALGQGAMGIGQTSLDPLAYPTKPQTTDQFDFSIERQFGSQTLKLGSYMKVNNDAVGYRQIVPGAQAVGFTTTSLGKVRADGVELTYTLNPRNEVNPGNVSALSGTTGFVTVSNQKVSIDNATTGSFSPEFDQRTSVVAGFSQGLGGGTRLGLSYSYGSGLTASQFQGGNRASLNEANARLQFGHKLFGVVSIDASVENLFNANSLVSYGSSFAGTRFQQGRRALLTLSAKY